MLSTEIVEGCRAGDRDAFRALYDLYKDRVYSIAFYFLNGDPSAASDVTQQVFLKLITSIGQFRGEAEFSTWLYRLVVNACVDVARGRKFALTAMIPHFTTKKADRKRGFRTFCSSASSLGCDRSSHCRAAALCSTA